jgi:hypothetical protein
VGFQRELACLIQPVRFEGVDESTQVAFIRIEHSTFQEKE